MKNLATLLFFLAVSTPVLAGIRPSFSPEGCSWRATDIVVVTEGSEIDGNFKVLETWKGDLKPGQTISVPELGQFKEKDARSIYSRSWVEKESDSRPRYVSGERMILFLRDANKPQGDSEDDDTETGESDVSTSRWKPTNPMGTEMKYSTAWIENGEVYCFVQIMNPGDPVIISAGTETELKTEVDCVVSTQSGLNTALAIPDLAARAESLEPFAKDSMSWARDRTFSGFTECGEAAFPVLRRMLDNESLREFHGDVIEALAKAGGKTVGPELTTWLEKEVEFWKRIGPTLQIGWWEGKGFGSDQENASEAVKPLQTRYQALEHAVYALGAIRYTAAERVLIELNNLLRAFPQLHFDQVTHACDEVLRDFGSNRKGLKAPKYEILFSGNKAFPTSLLQEKVAEYVAAYDTLENGWVGDVGYAGPVDYATYRLISFYTRHGYLTVGFQSEVRTTERGDSTSVRITEGKSYRLGKIKITGAKLVSPERIRAMLPLREGDIADGEVLRKWLVDDLGKIYRDLGYFNFDADDGREFRVDPQSGADVVDYNIKIEERAQYKVQAIKFAGKSSISRDRLIRVMSLHEGEVFSRKQLDDSIDELNKLGVTLDKHKDVSVVEDRARDRVTVKIILDEQGRANESFDRSTSKRSWYP